jgi:uncharacterized protein with PQ loop repeat
MDLKLLFKKIGSSLLAGIIGATVGIFISIVYVLKIWIPLNIDKIGLAVIVVLPLMLVLFAILGIIFGGILGIILSVIVKLLKRK